MAIEKLYWWGQTYLFHLSFQCLSAIEPAIMRIQCTVVARNTGAWKSRTDFSYKEDAYKHSHHYHLNSAMSVCSSHCSLKPLVQFFTGKECSVIKVLKLYPNRFKKSAYIVFNTTWYLLLAYVSVPNKLKPLSMACSEEGEDVRVVHIPTLHIPGTNAF